MQSAPDLLGALDAITGIPAPAPILIHPRIFAAYGAMITAATLATLYLYRGRSFIVYWIGSWVLFSASLLLVGRGYADARVGSVMIGLANLLAVWSAGLLVLAAGAFPSGTLHWTVPIRIAAATAVWFLAAPFVVPLDAVSVSGLVATAALVGWAATRYLQRASRSKYFGLAGIGAGMIVLSVTGFVGAGVTAGIFGDANALNALLAINVVVSMLIALGMHVLVFEDMTDELRRTNRDLAQAHQEVKRLAITDALTGCHNRRFFEEIQRREVQRHRRYNAPLCVVFIDVNRFKQLNDTLGHDVGDRMLQSIGKLLRRNVRESDYVIRWGGDEFLLLLTCTEEDAHRKADELRAAFAEQPLDARLPAGFGLSIGSAAVPPDAEDLDETIRQADANMYKDKRTSSAAGALH
jgi:diguanylate cyclase (GGDEF)-like protein